MMRARRSDARRDPRAAAGGGVAAAEPRRLGPLVLDPPPIGTARVLFDISRLLRNRRRRFPTGVDRIDLAMGGALVAAHGPACLFVHAAEGGPALLPHALGAALLAALRDRWHGDGDGEPPLRPLRLAAAVAVGQARLRLGGAERLARAGATYVNASHSGLPLRAGALERLDPGGRLERIAYVHDVIPLEFPEYQTPHGIRRFEAFLERLAARPIRFLANSADTAERLSALAARRGWEVRSVAPSIPRFAPGPPGAGPLRPAVRAIRDGAAPYFVAIGTIEPRKNHLLLLHLWRGFAAAGAPPLLVIVGRRGWENEMVVDMLERCAALRPHVVEFGDLTDAETHALLRGARALLMPSFAEGLGLPLLEAAAVGAPAVVSDLPAFREIAPEGTVFLDPLDGPGWARAIRDRLR